MKSWRVLSLVLVASLFTGPSAAEDDLDRLAARFTTELENARGLDYRRLLQQPHPAARQLHGSSSVRLMYVGKNSFPVYYVTTNLEAARSVSTDQVWPGSPGGFSITGIGTSTSELAVWDLGAVRATHQEFGGRATQIDFVGDLSVHATHVAGTMIAGGVRAVARGMSREAQLSCYDFNNDLGEMATAAGSGLRLSNHSYGPATGWLLQGPDWYWFGDTTIDPVEDYLFGYYSSFDADLDELARNAPYYLICSSAGNDRVEDGPAPGGAHFVLDQGLWVSSNDIREEDGGADGYDSISWKRMAKNILVVGSVRDVPGGYSSPADVIMTGYSAFGPTDDGRIRPDLVGNGVQVFSSSDVSDSSYATFGGTSMSTPNVTGSANLVREYYEDSHSGNAPTAALLKTILLHTADESGDAPGPDYRFGWGLLNTLSAALLIQADSASGGGQLIESALASSGAVDEYTFSVSAAGEFRATVGWADPPGTPLPPGLNDPTSSLVNDLDLRLVETSSALTYEPWVLDPLLPAQAATPGDNFRDNTEQVWVASLPAGDYALRITAKNPLFEDAPQTYALVSDIPLTPTVPSSAPEVASVVPGIRMSPNPVRGRATIELQGVASGTAEISIFDVSGRRVRSLGTAPGNATVTWDGLTNTQTPAPGGVYFVRAKTERGVHSLKFVVAR